MTGGLESSEYGFMPYLELIMVSYMHVARVLVVNSLNYVTEKMAQAMMGPTRVPEFELLTKIPTADPLK